jgi:hypothetical protein
VLWGELCASLDKEQRVADRVAGGVPDPDPAYIVPVLHQSGVRWSVRFREPSPLEGNGSLTDFG